MPIYMEAAPYSQPSNANIEHTVHLAHQKKRITLPNIHDTLRNTLLAQRPGMKRLGKPGGYIPRHLQRREVFILNLDEPFADDLVFERGFVLDSDGNVALHIVYAESSVTID